MRRKSSLEDVARDLVAATNARWHRALDDIEQEPPGPIRDHIAAHNAALRAEALRDAADQLDRDGITRLRRAGITSWLRGRAAQHAEETS